MHERYLVLDRRIRKDLQVMQRLWASLRRSQLASQSTDIKDVVFVGYNLHGLYNAVENIFRNITASFGNHLDTARGWHADLLDRMRLDLSPMRPAVIDDQTFTHLDELRRFRHLFRSAYGVELDAERLRLVHQKALLLEQSLPAQLESFLAFLATLEGNE